MRTVHPCVIEEVKHSTQKELRIIDTLGSVMARHKLVFDRKVIIDDFESAKEYDSENKFQKTLIYQTTHVTHSRGAIRHDDRLDALAIAVNFWVERIGQDVDKGIASLKERVLDSELKDFIKSAIILSEPTDRKKYRTNVLFKTSPSRAGGARL
jgi:hypothetical protein